MNRAGRFFHEGANALAKVVAHVGLAVDAAFDRELMVEIVGERAVERCLDQTWQEISRAGVRYEADVAERLRKTGGTGGYDDVASASDTPAPAVGYWRYERFGNRGPCIRKAGT